MSTSFQSRRIIWFCLAGLLLLYTMDLLKRVMAMNPNPMLLVEAAGWITGAGLLLYFFPREERAAHALDPDVLENQRLERAILTRAQETSDEPERLEPIGRIGVTVVHAAGTRTMAQVSGMGPDDDSGKESDDSNHEIDTTDRGSSHLTPDGPDRDQGPTRGTRETQ